MAEDREDLPGEEAPAPATFEQSLGELSSIVERLEDGELGLAEALEQYEQGMSLLKQCYALLERAERRVELLCSVDESQQPVVAPFDVQASAAAAEATPSKSRRPSMNAAAEESGRRRKKAQSAPPPELF